jgi:hypothetical protein
VFVGVGVLANFAAMGWIGFPEILNLSNSNRLYRSAFIALISYTDNSLSYIIAAQGMKVTSLIP